VDQEALPFVQELKAKGITVRYDQNGRFLGYSDDEEDFQNTLKAMAEYQKEVADMPWGDPRRWCNYRTDIPWQNQPMTYQEYCTMEASEKRVELEQKWHDWNEWRMRRYWPVGGDLRPAPNFWRRSIYSNWPDRVARGERMKTLRKAENDQDSQFREPPPDGNGDSQLLDTYGQSCIQKSDTVETHTFQSSEGQLRKPTELFRAEVIAARSLDWHNTVNARSDDLLALKVEQRLDLDLSGKAEVMTSLNEDLGPDLEVSKPEEHPYCSKVRLVSPPEIPAWKVRRKEMADIERFLETDSTFADALREMGRTPPADRKAQEAWFFRIYQRIYQYRHRYEDECLFEERCRQVARYVQLREEERVDPAARKGLREEFDRLHEYQSYDERRGVWVHYAYNKGLRKKSDGPIGELGQYILRGERASGPSHVDDGGGDTSQNSLREDIEGRAGGQDSDDGSSQGIIMCTELTSTLGQTGTCAGCSSPLNT
jgi:hypothetical protein